MQAQASNDSGFVDVEALQKTCARTKTRDSQTSFVSWVSQHPFKIDTNVIYDAILGLSDGLTVPFALTAGLASLGTTRIVILGGLAELVAGAISMGLGGFVDSESYQTDKRKCSHLILEKPDEVRKIIENHFSNYRLSKTETARIVDDLVGNEVDLKQFLLQQHFHSEKPSAARPYASALTLGLSYFLGGFLALIPYFCVAPNDVYTALWWSIGIMSVVMLIFGYVKTCVVRGWQGKDNIKAGIKGALQMLVVGAMAVGAAVGLVKAIEHGHGFAT